MHTIVLDLRTFWFCWLNQGSETGSKVRLAPASESPMFFWSQHHPALVSLLRHTTLCRVGMKSKGMWTCQKTVFSASLLCFQLHESCRWCSPMLDKFISTQSRAGDSCQAHSANATRVEVWVVWGFLFVAFFFFLKPRCQFLHKNSLESFWLCALY